MNGNRRFSDAIKTLDIRKDDKPLYFSGMLGTVLNGVNVIHIPSRPGFVWVRLRSVSNELIQAYNSLVSPIYDLPVIVERDPLDPTRYSIIGRDVGRYDSWGAANSPAYTNPVIQTTYYPNFYNDGMFVAASGTVIDFGANLNVVVTGSVVFISAVDTSHVIVYEDSVYKATGTVINFGANLNVSVTGSTVFVSAVGGGGADLLIYDGAAFKVTGTAINFGSNLDVAVTGSTAYVQAIGGGFSGELPIYEDATFKVTGTAIVFGNNMDVAVTGTTAFVSALGGGGSGGAGANATILAYDYSVESGSWTLGSEGSSYLGNDLRTSPGADKEMVDYITYLSSGTYTLRTIYHKSMQAGILDIDINGTEVGSIDAYDAGVVWNVRSTITGIGISSTGSKTIRYRLDGKNASSGGYDAYFVMFSLTRTA